MSVDVVCFGEMLWDLHEAKPNVFTRHVGGASANVAIALARLGVTAGVAGGVGDDAFGRVLVERLDAEGIDTRFVKQLPNRTAVTFIARDADGEPTYMNYRQSSADAAFGPKHVDAAMARARWIVIATATPSSPEGLAAAHAIALRARKAGASVAVDLNVRPQFFGTSKRERDAVRSLVARADLVKASTRDLALVGLEPDARAATWLVTSGRGGALARGAHGSAQRAAKRARCVDATGAGDAFLAGALAMLLARDATPCSAAWEDPAVWTDALEVGHHLGAKAVSKVGAAAGLVGLGAVRRRLDAMKRQRT